MSRILIDRCLIAGSKRAGIYAEGFATTGADLVVKNTEIRCNGGVGVDLSQPAPKRTKVAEAVGAVIGAAGATFVNLTK